MAESLTVRERIERQAAVVLATVEGVDAVERYDTRGNTIGNGVGVVAAGNDRIDNDADGDVGYTLKTMQLDLMVCMCPVDEPEQGINSSDRNTSADLNRILGRLESAAMADVHWTESGGAYLAIDSDVVAVSQMPVMAEDPRETAYYAIVSVDVQYRHPKDDPYTVS